MLSRLVRAVAGTLIAGVFVTAAQAESKALTDRGVGRSVANFTLKDTQGRPVSLYGFWGKKAAVLVFLGTDCPLGNLYAPRLAELNKEYAPKGVVFVGINANAHESEQQVADHAKEHGIDFTVLKDPGNVVADQLLVERTCEALVLDARAVMRYRGAIDDQYTQGARKPTATHQYVRDALDAVLAGKPVETRSSTVAGCLLDRAEVVAAAQAKRPRVRAAASEITQARALQEQSESLSIGKVTYAGEVAAILQNKCQSCHRPGQVGGFSLLSFDDAQGHAAMLREVVSERRMPPWHADPRFGHFQNDRSLSARDRATLLAWVDQGTPLGDPSKLPAPRAFNDAWSIGTPDAVFQIPEEYPVAAQGVLEYVRFRVPSGFTEDRWIQAAEAQPGDRAVVHHIIVYVQDPANRGDRRGLMHLCGFAPGDMPSIYPAGTAKRIPANSDLIFEIHYTPDGKLRADRSRVGLVFAKESVKHQAHTKGVAQHRFVIPPGAGNYEVKASYVVPKDVVLLSFMPHMHLRGKSFEYTATFPDGKSEVLLSIPAYDFGWQSYYTLAEPRLLPKGTRIDCRAHFDNSKENAANPDPNKEVRWGDQTFQEMMIGYIDFSDAAEVAPKSSHASTDGGAGARASNANEPPN